MPVARFRHLDGTVEHADVKIVDGHYPAVLTSPDLGREWVLAQRPGVQENTPMRPDGTLEPAPEQALYEECSSVDAVCLTCADRIRVRFHLQADAILRMCLDIGHDTMILPTHLADFVVIPFCNRTVGDIRDSTTLIQDASQ